MLSFVHAAVKQISFGERFTLPFCSCNKDGKGMENQMYENTFATPLIHIQIKVSNKTFILTKA